MVSAVNPDHPMTELAAENAFKFLALVIWKLRRHCPNLSVEITKQDMEELAAVFMNSGQRGVVNIIGKGDRIVLQLVDQATGQMLVTVDGGINAPHAKMMRQVVDARKRAQSVADRLIANGTDKALREEAAEILKLLTWEPKT